MTITRWAILGVVIGCVALITVRVSHSVRGGLKVGSRIPPDSTNTTILYSNPSQKHRQGRFVSLSSFSDRELAELLFSAPRRDVIVETNHYQGPVELRTYTENSIVAEANRLNRALQFFTNGSGGALISLDDLIYKASVGPHGINASFGTRDWHHTALISEGALELYANTWFQPDVFGNDIRRLEALRRAPDHLNEPLAAQKASVVLRDLGYSAEDLKAYGKPKITRGAVSGLPGGDSGLPYYTVEYLERRGLGENPRSAIRVTLLGIVPGGLLIGIDDYSFTKPRLPKPENYDEILQQYPQFQRRRPR